MSERAAPRSLRRGAPPALCPVSLCCAGCPLIPIDYPRQLELKLERFLACWTHRGLPNVRPRIVPSDPHLGYRNRLRLRIDERGEVRFFNPHKATNCVVLQPSLLEGIQRLGAAARKHRGALMGFAHAEVRAPDARGIGGIVLYQAAPWIGHDGVAAVFDELRGEGWQLVAATIGEARNLPRQTWRLLGEVYVQVPLDAFLQINTSVNRALVAHVADELEKRPGREFMDLYMGAGNFALPLLSRGFRGVGVELCAGAARAAREAAELQAFRFEQVCQGDSLAVGQSWLAKGRRFDAVIVDPPRAGLKAGAPVFARLARQTLVACSCNPSTLARDVHELRQNGFEVSSVTLFDMFPHTVHLEAVVWLDRR